MADGKPAAGKEKRPAGQEKPPATQEKPPASQETRPGAAGGSEAPGKPGRKDEGLGGPGAPSLDTAWAAFRTADAGQFIRATLLLPAGVSGPVRIRSENRNGWRDDTRIEAASGRILVREVGGERPLGVRIAGNMLDVHSGRFFGVLGPPIFLVAALLMPLFLVTGLLLYVGRRAAAARRRGTSTVTPAVTSARLTP